MQLTELLHSELEQLVDMLEVFMVLYEIWGSYSSISAREGNQIIRYLCIGFESWELNKDIAKQLRTCEREFYEEFFVGIKVNEDWRKQYNEELMQLFEDLDILSFVRMSWLNWIDHVSRMDSKRKVSQVFNSNPQGSRLRGR